MEPQSLGVFISWSGERSRLLARVVRDWISMAIQMSDCFMSSEDIRLGQRWLGEVNSRLQAMEVGILCVTPENLNSTWMHFEAGALAKHLSSSRLVPLTWGFDPGSLEFPLAQFQGVRADEAGFRSLLTTLAQATPYDIDADKTFAVHWPQLREALEGVSPSDLGAKLRPPSADDLLREILATVRGIQERLPVDSSASALAGGHDRGERRQLLWSTLLGLLSEQQLTSLLRMLDNQQQTKLGEFLNSHEFLDRPHDPDASTPPGYA